MIKKIDLFQSSGKTVEGVAFSIGAKQLAITFTDGSFSVIGIERGWESCDDKIDDTEFDINDFPDSVLVEFNIITQDEIDDLRNSAQDERNKEAEEIERLEFERLRKKFGDE